MYVCMRAFITCCSYSLSSHYWPAVACCRLVSYVAYAGVTDDDRCQRPSLVSPPTLQVGGPVIIDCVCLVNSVISISQAHKIMPFIQTILSFDLQVSMFTHSQFLFSLQITVLPAKSVKCFRTNFPLSTMLAECE